MQKLRIGIIGGRGAALIAGLRTSPHAEVLALCETDPHRLAQACTHHEIPLPFTNYEAMLNAIDAVVVATPMHLHVPQSLLALQAGKHVLSEVTAAISLEECWRLLDAVHASSKTYMMAENVCFTPENTLICELARKGLFGELYFGEGEYLHEVRKLHHNPDGSPTWRYFWQVGTNGNTYGTHGLGPVRQWFDATAPNDRIETVICLGSGRHTDPAHPHEDTTLTLCKMQSGRLIKNRLDMMSNRPYALNFALQGTNGAYESARATGEHGRIWLGENREGEARAWRPISDYWEHLPEAWKHVPEAHHTNGHDGGDYHTGRLFVECLLNQTPPPIDIYDALEWTAAGLCSQTSIANGGVPIRLPNFRNPAERPLWLDA